MSSKFFLPKFFLPKFFLPKFFLPKFFLPSILLTLFYLSATAASATAAGFANPVLKTPSAGCRADNLRIERFNPDVDSEKRLKVCQAIDKIADKLNSVAWSPALYGELKGIWQVFSTEAVTLRLMPKDASSRMLAMAEAFPSGSRAGSGFEACVYLRPNASNNASFFQVLLHELRHVYDFHETWKNKGSMSSLEVERRAFLLMGKLSQESHESVPGVPKFWKESWQNLSAVEIAQKREAAVDKFLHESKFYRQLAGDQNRQALDFSSQKNIARDADWEYVGDSQDSDKVGERIPTRPALPTTAARLPQNIQELGFNLEKPKNPRDENEVLRVALANEKKLYYGMSNFVYDQKLQFQCWQKGKVASSFSEDNTVSRTGGGSVLFKQISSPSLANSGCTLDSQNLKTDFSETFWGSPALEKMPIRFAGFVDVEGQTLARYTVLQPSPQLYAELASQFNFIKPFRVFVGTIFVSPEDGQIVRFWGTSFPEDTVTGSNSKKVWGSYSVTALRQKLEIDGGLWVTVYVGTVAVANVGGNSRPFSYTVKFENYRQSTTDVRILDDETAVNSSTAGSR